MDRDSVNQLEHSDFFNQSLERSRQKLLDLTRRNRLLNFREGAKDIAIIDEMADLVFNDLLENNVEFEFGNTDELQQNLDDEIDAQGKLTEDIFSDLDRSLPESLNQQEIEEKYQDSILQTPYSETLLNRKLRNLYSASRSYTEETGANALYLAIGFLEWSDSRDSKTCKAPLIMIPIQMKKLGVSGEGKFLIKYSDEPISNNYSLSEKLLHDFDIKISEYQSEVKPEAYWNEIDQIIPLSLKESGWKIIREMTIGLFSFSKQVMWHDLNPANWPAHAPLENKKVLRNIILGTDDKEQTLQGYNSENRNNNFKNNNLKLVRDADLTQQKAIIKALESEDGLVIEGPPGTGKSQTITNLIAVALSQNKSILFVAEKMAALDVVYKHLADVGLDVFCLQLHGLKSSKKELLESLKKKIEFNPHHDIYMGVKEDKLEVSRQKLLAFSKLLNQQLGPENLPLYDIFWRVERLSQNLPGSILSSDLEVEFNISSSEFDENRNLLNDLGTSWDSIPESVRNSWIGFLPDKINDADIENIKHKLESLILATVDFEDFLVQNPKNKEGKAVFTVQALLNIDKSFEYDNFSKFNKVDELLIGEIVNQSKLNEFEDLSAQIKKYFDNIELVNRVFSYSHDNAHSYAQLLYRHYKQLSGNVINPAVKINQLESEAIDFKKLIGKLENLNSDASYVSNLIGVQAVTIEAHERLLKSIHELKDINIEFIPLLHSEHVNSNSSEYLSLAKDKFESIVQLEKKQNTFLIHKEITSDELKDIKIILEQNISNFFAFLNKDYRLAKRKILPLLKNTNGFSKSLDFIDQLETYISYVYRKEEFLKDELFINSLGVGFKGIDTNWENVDEVIKFAEKLKDKVGKINAQNILSNWNRHYAKLEIIENKITKTFKMLEQFKSNHPFPESTWTKSLSQVISDLIPWGDYIQKAYEQLNQGWCNTDTSFTELRQVLKLFYTNIKFESEIQKNHCYPIIKEKLWKGHQTDISQLVAINQWIETRIKLPGINSEVLSYLFNERNKFQNDIFDSLMNKTSTFLTELQAFKDLLCSLGQFNLNEWIDKKPIVMAVFVEKLKIAIDSTFHLKSISKWVRFSLEADKKRLTSISSIIKNNQIKGSQAADMYEYLVHKTLLNREIESKPELESFSSSSYENLQKRFAELDRQVLANNANRIQNTLKKNVIPKGTNVGKVSNKTQLSLIKHEIGKKTRHLPVRQLMNRAGQAIIALKPCFLMSPLSVSQYLSPGEFHFDFVVMDEASQIKPEDALSAIARGNKVIIVGDSKQLPPTSFFSVEVERTEEDEETVLDDTESILEVCSKQMKFERLKFHYRSEHESLIQFSNLRFYESDLITIPSPYNQSNKYGVFYKYIEDSNYLKGKNPNEAKVVVEYIIKHFQSFPNKSLGVATFNKAQAELITLLIDKARQHHHDLNNALTSEDLDNKFFVKNLENVQGDERDVIIISTTYGPETKGGQVAQRFGPINSELGWRRLNVIASRAKQKMMVITSLKPSDIRVTNNTRKGLKEFKKFLEFIYSGAIGETGVETGKEPDSDFEVSVINIINQLGYECHPQVGVSKYRIDIGVVNPKSPGEYLLGVECDGAAYHSSISARDRDRLRQENLERKGWNIHRIWSTDWFNSRDIEIYRLEKAIKSSLEAYQNNFIDIKEPSNASFVETDVKDLVATEYEDDENEKTLDLKEALNRFWKNHISPDYPNKGNSILNNEVINYLVKEKPINDTEWFRAVPVELREKIDVKQMQFKEDILNLIFEYS
ncbi:hypothetical protein GCM10011365_16850 [Marinicella pacifica]|uniref:AAA domain-containing protein n=1 Tax=Marinicella pacifica TaxID=1171543 RepID=A0A917CRG4_9GAMM|nr:DUF4011 domain-containing protein [Marinicella pacifica]GGF96171.1 hypothetical protein GCM10011365_16850 [Marinicella pacifica]